MPGPSPDHRLSNTQGKLSGVTEDGSPVAPIADKLPTEKKAGKRKFLRRINVMGIQRSDQPGEECAINDGIGIDSESKNWEGFSIGGLRE